MEVAPIGKTWRLIPVVRDGEKLWYNPYDKKTYAANGECRDFIALAAKIRSICLAKYNVRSIDLHGLPPNQFHQLTHMIANENNLGYNEVAKVLNTLKES